uniref:Uncharacterized protein n=1 Tax=Alexandrium monilatum TaxID=311494 RepID=A0A7S4V5U8_9DINO
MPGQAPYMEPSNRGRAQSLLSRPGTGPCGGSYGSADDLERIQAHDQVKAFESQVFEFGQKFKPPKFLMRVGVFVLCLAAPWLLFLVLYALQSFSMHYNSSVFVRAVIGVTLVLVVILTVFSFTALRMTRFTGEQQAWLLFFSSTCVAAWLCGVLLGQANYESNMFPSYELQQLNVYRSVDPSTYQGIQLADAGRVYFTKGSYLDIYRSIGFKNFYTYCVAPVVSKSGAGAQNISHDIWAVGIDCCSGQGPDFRCGEYKNPKARAGLRLVREDQKGFFRLAVQQAEAAYNIKATNPIFFYWLQEPEVEVALYQDDGNKYFALGAILAFLLQFLLSVVATVLISKLVCH